MYIALVLLALVLIFAFLIRSLHITSLPVFVDEAIYIRWSQVMKAEPTLRFLPLSDGKQPLFMWVVIPFLKLFSDPLIAGRAVSILSGLGTIIGIFILAHLLFKSKKVSLLASLLYAVSPYGVFFDRLALVDSLLAMCGIWTFVFALLVVKTRRLDTALFAGFMLGAALITKSPALFFVILLLSVVIFIKNPRNNKLSSLYTILLLSVSMGVSVVIFNLLRLGPNFHLIFSRNLDYVHPLSHILTHPTDPFISNFKEYLSWLKFFGPYPLFFMLIAAVLNSKKYPKQVLFLLLIALGPVLIQSEYSIAFTARYVLFTIPFLLILAASSLLNLRVKYFVYIFIIWFVVLAVYRDVVLITNPTAADLPQNERSGYLEEWTSGFGIKEVSEKLIEIRDANPDQRILVGTEGYFGTLPDGLQIYLEKQPNITVIGVGLGIKQVPVQLVEHKETGGRSFLVANSSRLAFEKDFDEMGLQVLAEYKKPDRTPGTHGYVQNGLFDTFYLLELIDSTTDFDIVLSQ